MSTSPRDAGIPMLTEVIEEDITEFVGPPEPALVLADTAPAADTMPATFPAYAPTFAASDYAQPAAMGGQYGMSAQFAPSYPIPLKPAAPAMQVIVEAPAQAALAPATPPPSAMSEDEWQRMERRVRERILGQLLSRTDAMLEERIRASMAGVLQQAVDGLAATLRASLHKTLQDVVSRAVAQEISRLQSPKK
jgi:hypothetical protein